MHGFWKKKLPAFLLALVLVTSFVPAAAAVDTCPQGGEHQWGEWVVSLEPTCSKTGTRIRTCVKCSTPDTPQEIPATGAHTYVVDSNTATCGKEGILTRHCTVCGEISSEASPATGSHTWKNTGTAVAATCTSTGSQPQTCSVCGATQTLSLPALGHTVNSTTGKCTRCGLQINAAAPNITVTFMNGSNTFTTRAVTSGTAPSTPGTPTYPTATTGCTYTFKGWTTTNPGTKAIYTNQALTNVTGVAVSANTTYYAVYTLTAVSQNLSVNAANTSGTVVGSSIVSELNSRFSALTGLSSFNTISFSNPSTNRGTLYTSSSRGAVSYNASYAASSLASFYFVPGSTSGYTVSYTATDAYNNKISGTLTISSGAVSGSTITYYVSPGGTVDFKTANFASAYRELSGDTSTLRWVAFSPSSSYGDLGYLYSGSLTLDRSRLINNDFYYSDSSYGQYALSSLNFKAASSARNGDSISIPFRAYYNNSVYYDGTVKIVVSQNGGDGVVTYRVAPGQSVAFDRTDFNNAYQNLTDSSRTIRYVAISAPNAYTSFSGKIRASGHSDFTTSDLSYTGTLFYYNSKSYGDYALDDLLFQATSSARDGDTLSMDFRAYYSRDDYATGTLQIIIDKNGSEDTVTATAAPGGSVRLDRDDFNAVYRALSNTSRTISHISFEAPSSYDSFAGTLYAGNTALTRTDLRHNGTWFYYNASDAGSRDYAITDLTFQADASAKNNASLNIPFRAYYSSSDYVDGTLKLSVNSSTGSQISYTVPVNGSVALKIDDFNNAYRTMSGYSSRTIAYVAFEAPNAYASFAGGLYTGSSGTAFTRTELSYTRTQFYYSNSRYGSYALSSLTFKTNSTARNGDTISIPFRAYYSDVEYEEGTLKITVGTSTASGDISYTVTPGRTVNFDRTDFNNFLRKSYSTDTLNYVIFEEPSTTDYAAADGTLYRGYGTSYSASFSRATLPSVRFYYNSANAGTRDYALDDLTFAAASSFTGKVTLRFTAYGTGSNSVSGSVVITPSTAAASSNIGGNIRYAVVSGTNVQLNANDFSAFYKTSYPTDTLQYVAFSDVPAVGALYYNFYSASSYGAAAREQITAANRASRTFYLSPASTSQYALTELTYVPSGSNYCAFLPFTAYGASGKSVTGTVLISVTTKAVSEVYGVTPKGVTVNFPAAAIYTAVNTATGSALSSIQLLKLPASTVGTIYAGTGTTLANTTTLYSYASSSAQMDQLRFAPASTYTGPVEIPYVALNANGTPICAGTFSLGVVNANKKFSDVTATTWCYKYVTELADASVIDGYADGSFKPDSTISYGAALKLVMLAAGYPEQAPTDKSSVFSGYLTRARADGLITRSNVELAKPITRLQVAQLAAGALKLDINHLSSVKPFTDTNDVYVQALNAAGIVEGYFSNGTSTFKPSNTLTRGQVSAIVWRMRNYRQGN